MSGPIVAVTIPPGCPPGGQFMAMAPSGVTMMIVNPGLPVGAVMHVRAPLAAPQPMVMAQQGPPPPPPEPMKVEEIKKEDIPNDAVIEKATVPGYAKTSLAEAPKDSELCPFVSCCCVTYSIYCAFPDCIGSYFKGVACGCIEVEQLCCKVSKTEGTLCKLCNGECEVVNPVGCCKLTATCCCVDARWAIPTDGEVPCQLACLGFVCVKSFKMVCNFYSTSSGQAATASV